MTDVVEQNGNHVTIVIIIIDLLKLYVSVALLLKIRNHWI